MSAIADRIQDLMSDAAQTEQDMAEHLNVDPSTITHWFNGQATPTVEQLLALAQHFGVDLNELDDLRQLVDSMPQAEAQLRKGNEWSVLEPVLTTFTPFLNYEKQLLKTE